MEEIIRRILEAAATGFAGDQLMERTGLGKRATGILDAIIPPAAAADASAIPQDLIPAKPVMTPAQEQQVMQSADRYNGFPYRENGETVGANALLPDTAREAQVTQMQPTQLPDISMPGTAEDRANSVQDFVRNAAVGTQQLLKEVPEEVQADPQAQKGAAALSTAYLLKAKSMADNERAQMTGELPSEEPDVETDSFLSKMFGNEEMMLTLALGFNSMRLQPDQGLAAALGKRLETLSTQRDRQRLSGMTGTATMQMLNEYPDIKAAYLSGQIDLKDALTYIQKMRRLELDEGAPAAFRALEARAKAAGLKPGTTEYNQFMINGGQRKGLSLRVGKDGSIELTEGGDLSSLTEAQSNALTFSQRMKASNLILNKTEQAGTSLYDRIVNNLPVAGNYLISEEYQAYDQAKRDFINATLRKESGAAIAASEFENADRQYFPTPGDTPAVIAQKRANRELAQKLIEANVPNVNKIVEQSGADIGAGARTLQTEQTQATKPPITPEQAKAELARRGK